MSILATRSRKSEINDRRKRNHGWHTKMKYICTYTYRSRTCISIYILSQKFPILFFVFFFTFYLQMLVMYVSVGVCRLCILGIDKRKRNRPKRAYYGYLFKENIFNQPSYLKISTHEHTHRTRRGRERRSFSFICSLNTHIHTQAHM